MRILVVTNKCPPDYDGGYELSAFQVANALRGRGHDVQLVTSHYRPTFKGTRADPDWVHRIFEFREWPSLSGLKIARSIADARRFAELTNVGVPNSDRLEQYLGGNTPDLAYCFGFHGIGLATGYALARRRIPILWHAGNYLIAQDLQLGKLLRRHRFAHRVGLHLLSRRARGMILGGDYRHIAFLSEAMIDEFERMGVPPQHAYVIPRGIDFELAPPEQPPPSTPSFLMASRISEEKGYGIALEAAGILAAASPLSWSLKIAGPGRLDYIDSLKTRAEELGIRERVHFLGMLSRDQVLSQMRDSTAFLSASIWEEPFGRTNIEALASGTALIAAETGAIGEIVGDSGCALTYERKDPAALAKCMQRVLEQPETRKDLVRKGLDRIRSKYTMEKILDLTESTFEKVLQDYGVQA